MLSAEWSKFAPVTFVNEVDDEEIPPGLESFRYLESGYELCAGPWFPLMLRLPNTPAQAIRPLT